MLRSGQGCQGCLGFHWLLRCSHSENLDTHIWSTPQKRPSHMPPKETLFGGPFEFHKDLMGFLKTFAVYFVPLRFFKHLWDFSGTVFGKKTFKNVSFFSYQTPQAYSWWWQQRHRHKRPRLSRRTDFHWEEERLQVSTEKRKDYRFPLRREKITGFHLEDKDYDDHHSSFASQLSWHHYYCNHSFMHLPHWKESPCMKSTTGIGAVLISPEAGT